MVTAFDFWEHVPRADLRAVFAEVRRVGIQRMYATIAHFPHQHKGLRLHETVEPYRWWRAFFEGEGAVRCKYSILRRLGGASFVEVTL